MKRLIFILFLTLLAGRLAGQVAPKMTSTLQVDADANSRTNPGDTLRYTITFTNTSGTNLLNVQFNNLSFPNQTLVGGSIKTTPVARPDTYSGVVGNTLFNVPSTSGVLTNDSDADGDLISVVTFSPTSAQGGTVIVTNNGGFSFSPAVGYTGTDTFVYTISDGNGGTNSSVVTLTIGNRVWYVNNAGVNGDGRQSTPFNSFASLNGAGDVDGTNDFIYLFPGSGSYGAGLVLESDQKLIGAGLALVVGGATIIPAGNRPTLGLGGAGVICSTNNTIQGLNITATAGKGIAGTNVGTLTVSSVMIAATGGAALDVDTGTAAITLDSAFSTNSTVDGLRLNALNGTVTINGGLVV
ncbi:MAG: cadherin-like domain-containing protein, partial [Opitutaceae bacterium]|nr:cadherin-like domain-containing protein [Verrucomicrobiales bacterium]